MDLLQTFATQSVIAIQNARLFREIDEKSRALEELSRNQEQLSRLSTALQEPLSLAEQLTRVLDAARQVVGLDRIYVWTLSPDAAGLMVTAQAGFEESDWRDLAGVAIPIARGGRAGRRLPGRRAAALHRRQPAARRVSPAPAVLRAGRAARQELPRHPHDRPGPHRRRPRRRQPREPRADSRRTPPSCCRPSPPRPPSPSRTRACSRRSRRRAESSSSPASTSRSSWPT